MPLARHRAKEGLLKQIMVEQAGDYRKGLIEAVQNSLPYDEPILILSGGEIRLVPIGEFVDRHVEGKENGFSESGRPDEPAYALSFTKRRRLEWRPIAKVFRHKYQNDMLEIVAEQGRRIRVTRGHTLFRLTRRAKSPGEAYLIPVPSSDLKVGDLIAAPHCGLLRRESVLEMLETYPWNGAEDIARVYERSLSSGGGKGGDLTFLKIREIRDAYYGGKWVYDVSVPGLENFVAGRGCFCVHNSEDGWIEKVMEERGLTAEDIKKIPVEELLKGLRIDVRVDGRTLTISDNGRGIWYDEHDERWQYFGPSWKSEIGTFYGHKGIGRGQIIAMLWDGSMGNINGKVDVWTNDLHIYDYDLSCGSPAPSYKYERTESLRPGMTWVLERPDGWNAGEIKEYLQEVVGSHAPFEVYFNGEPLWEEVDKKYDKVIKTEDFTVWVRNSGGSFRTYNGYRYIRDYTFMEGLSGKVEIRPLVAQNFARNDFISSDPVWQRVKTGIEDRLFEYLIRRAETSPSDLTLMQVRGLLRHIAGRGLWERYKDIKFVPDIKGNLYSLSELREKGTVWCGEKGTRLAGEAAQQGFLVFPKELEYALTNFTSVMEVEKAPIKPPEHREIPREEWSEAERKFVGFWRLISRTKRRIGIGVSSSSVAWTDGATYVIFNRQFIPTEALERGDWREVFEKTFETMAHELAHREANYIKDDHTQAHCERQIELMDEFVKNFNREFPEYKVPEDFARRVVASACAIDFNPSEFENRISLLYDRWKKVKHGIISDERDENAEFECIKLLDEFEELSIMYNGLRGKIPNYSEEKYKTLSEEMRRYDVLGYPGAIVEEHRAGCRRWFKKMPNPTLLTQLAKGAHRNFSDMRTVLRVRPQYCRIRYRQAQELDDRVTCWFWREYTIYEATKGLPEGERVELFQTCVLPNMPAPLEEMKKTSPPYPECIIFRPQKET